MKKNILFFVIAVGMASCQQQNVQQPSSPVAVPQAKIMVADAPINEVLNADYRVQVDNRQVPVYNSRIAIGAGKQNVDEVAGSYEKAGFAYFDLIEGTAEVTVGYSQDIRSAKLVSNKTTLIPDFRGNTLMFKVSEPQNIQVIINNDSIHTLDIFVNPEETDVPDPKDPKVVYFGPGSFRLPSAALEDGMTVYVAAGAVVHCYVGPHEWYTVNEVTGLKNYAPFYMLDLMGKNIKVCGRGILDADNTPLNSRRGIHVSGEDISLDGVILRNSSECGIYIDNAQNVEINNVKVLNYRFNADGIDVIQSKDVQVNGSFIKAQQPIANDGSPVNISTTFEGVLK